MYLSSGNSEALQRYVGLYSIECDANCSRNCR